MLSSIIIGFAAGLTQSAMTPLVAPDVRAAHEFADSLLHPDKTGITC
ncbi:hypothetical protein HOE425_333023 [Hoeflea sp. EC-HK425]|nr:hypothetical protein HOE425_333023 [Hoeflea sp. EC-HK425]